jgi:hypothetical protein
MARLPDATGASFADKLYRLDCGHSLQTTSRSGLLPEVSARTASEAFPVSAKISPRPAKLANCEEFAKGFADSWV